MDYRDQDQHTRPEGRTVRARVFGDNAGELELEALDTARKFFGGDVALEIVDAYHASSANSSKDSNGKRYVAEIVVRALNR